MACTVCNKKCDTAVWNGIRLWQDNVAVYVNFCDYECRHFYLSVTEVKDYDYVLRGDPNWKDKKGSK